MEVGGLILAGGKSRRMGGLHKGELRYQKQTFMERIIREFQKETSEIWLSYGTDIQKAYPGCQIVQDEYPGCGPIAGLHAGLKQCKQELVMVSACDMPNIGIELYHFLYRHLMNQPGVSFQGVIPIAGGRIHPLAAIYKKSLAGKLEEQIKKSCYRLQDALSSQALLFVDLTEQPKLITMLTNINTLEEYKAIEAKSTAKTARQKLIAVCGLKNSGKTTLLTHLIRELTKRGLKTAVIKHDGHDFTCDIPGTDSYRFLEAGAYGTGVYSQNRMFLHKLVKPDLKEMLAQFPEADILFVEGMKESRLPKIEVIRKAISDQPISNPEGRFLIVTDWENDHFREVAVGFEEKEEIIKKILEQD